MSKHYFRHKVLLDENLPPRQDFLRLNEHCDVKHIEHDLKLSGAKDPAIYNLAVSQRRIIVSRDNKHFRPQIGTKDDEGGIAIPPHWTPAQIDTRLTALLMRDGPNYFAGKYHTLAEE
jgi:uncharacterized protein DUF5615